ncbi:hypothetical protein HK103_001901 [Boothiomyces macroporosus]|uniref:Uncharacterized protein n=1 Tax=Boothiomyces macroporosus TaxID=261099 RepID=A0AAD5UDN5_9FUNG|nr:hypothetical protein HK103_001901 [Boothiomyces macroporosus]
MQIPLALLYSVVAADYLIEGAYFGKGCGGPPDTLYAFKTDYVYSYVDWSPTLNETWPPFYKFHASERSVDDGGDLNVDISGDICIETTDYASSQPYRSGYVLFYDPLYELDFLPIAADGTAYCYLKSDNFAVASNLNGYLAAYFRMNDNVCYDDHYKCLSNGNFQYYTASGCSGSVEIIPLTLTSADVTSANLGNVTTLLKTVQNGQVYFSWLTAVPVGFLVPQFDIAMDYIAVICYCITLMIALYVQHSAIHVLRRTRAYHFTLVVSVVSATFWILYFVFDIIYWALPVTNFGIIAGIAELKSIFIGIASFLNCYLNAYLLSEQYFPNQKQMQKVIPIALFVVHIALFGSAYLYYWIDMGSVSWSVYSWTDAVILWYFLMYAFNSFTPILIARRMLKKKISGSMFETFDRIDPNLKYFILGQILIFIAYGIIFILRKGTAVLYSDFVVLDFSSVSCLFFAIHSILAAEIFKFIVKSAKAELGENLNSQID